MNRPVHEEESRTTQSEPVDKADSSGAWSRTGRRVEVLVRKGPSLHHRRRDGPKHLLHRAQRVVGVRAREEEATCGELEQAASQAPDIDRRAVLRAEDELRRAVPSAADEPGRLSGGGPRRPGGAGAPGGDVVRPEDGVLADVGEVRPREPKVADLRRGRGVSSRQRRPREQGRCVLHLQVAVRVD